MTQGQHFEVGELFCVAETGEAWQAGSKRERILVGELQTCRGMAYHVAFLQWWAMDGTMRQARAGKGLS